VKEAKNDGEMKAYIHAVHDRKILCASKVFARKKERKKKK